MDAKVTLNFNAQVIEKAKMEWQLKSSVSTK